MLYWSLRAGEVWSATEDAAFAVRLESGVTAPWTSTASIRRDGQQSVGRAESARAR